VVIVKTKKITTARRKGRGLLLTAGVGQLARGVVCREVPRYQRRHGIGEESRHSEMESSEKREREHH
jgi:hypothetical protein